MKKFFYLIVFATCLGLNAYSNVKAYMNYAVFYAPGKGTYLETYLSVSGQSVMFLKKEAKKYQGKIHIEINFMQDGKSVVANAYNLLSPETADTNNKPNFIDLQRYKLGPGTYQAEIKIVDANDTKQTEPSAKLTIVIPEQTDDISISDIELVESFQKSEAKTAISKSGYDIVPYPLTSFSENVDKLIFYVEGYNTLKNLGADSKFLYNYYIESAETKVALDGLSTFSKQTSKEVVPLIGQFNISKMHSGKYNLVIEIRNSLNEVKAQKKIEFTRIAPQQKIALNDLKSVDTTGGFINNVTNPDTLKDYIACLWPLSTTSERDWQGNQIKSNNVKLMQQYIIAFWQNRNPSNPQAAWEAYKKEVKKVNRVYKCGGQPGYMSDRGRVYLQYGAADAAQQVPTEPDSYPYEIWQYYRIKNPTTGQFQTNKKFVFYNPTLDGKCYMLLHSDARGEIRDDRWQVTLKKRNNQIMNFDQNSTGQNSYGDGAADLFNNPR